MTEETWKCTYGHAHLKSEGCFTSEEFKRGYEQAQKVFSLQLQTLVSKLEGEKLTQMDIAKNADLSFLNYTPTQIFNNGLSRAKEIALEMGKGEK